MRKSDFPISPLVLQLLMSCQGSTFGPVNVLGKKPIVSPREIVRVLRVRSLIDHSKGTARPPSNWLDGKHIIVAREYNDLHETELCSSKPHCALAPPPPESGVQSYAPPEIGNMQVDESQSSHSSKDLEDTYHKPWWLLGVQHDSLAQWLSFADNQWYDI